MNDNGNNGNNGIINKIRLLFGGAGFLGKELISDFDKNDVVIVFDLKEANQKFKDLISSKEFKTEVQTILLYDIDLAHESIIDKKYHNGENYYSILNKLENGLFHKLYIYHLASPVGVMNHLVSTFYEAMYINQNVFNFCERLPLNFTTSNRKFLYFNYMSSSELYGNTVNFQDRTINLNTFFQVGEKDGGYRSDYIYQKALGEALFTQLKNEYKVNIFRLFNIVGRYQDPNKGIFNKFINDIYFGLQSMVTDSIRCYTDAYDFCETVEKENRDLSLGTPNIINVVDREFKNSLRSKELYLYINTFISETFKETKLNYITQAIPNEIHIRGSSRTMSYSNFVSTFGYLIEKVWKDIEQKNLEDNKHNV